MTRQKKMRKWRKLCGGCSIATYLFHFHDDGKKLSDVGQNKEEKSDER